MRQCAKGERVRRRGMAAAAVGLLVVMVWGVAGCGESGGGGAADEGGGDELGERPVVVASIYPLADLARQVAGEGFEVETLLPAGASPHGYEMTPGRLRLLSRADVVLTVGLGMDAWAEQAAESVGQQVAVLRMAEMVDAEVVAAVGGGGHEHGHDDEYEHEHEHEHGYEGGFDYENENENERGRGAANDHLWLDPVLVKQWVAGLRDELAARYPDEAEAIERNAAEVLASLDELDRAYREQLAGVTRKELVTFHNAFDRLAWRYGLEVVAHLTDVHLEHGAEVQPRRWREAVEAVRRHELGVLYSEPQFSPREVEALQRETGAEVLQLDPIGHPGRAELRTYQQMMRFNLKVLVEGQGR